MSNSPVIVWFRRDLRLADHRALHAASRCANGAGVLGVFIVDRVLLGSSGPTRVNYLARTVASLNESMNGRLVIRTGDPAEVLQQLATKFGVQNVFATQEYSPYGIRRDERVRRRLAGAAVQINFVDSNYLVAPGSVRSASDQPLKVFGAFRRRWDPLVDVDEATDLSLSDFVEVPSETAHSLVAIAATRRPSYFGDLPDGPAEVQMPAGEAAAASALTDFVSKAENYADQRDRPDLEGTSRLSAFIRFGVLHPRQIVRALAMRDVDNDLFLSELAWREFYADVLFHQPKSTQENLNSSLRLLRVDRDVAAEQRFRTWALGETGYPFVDAAMRQLLQEGWMHNRARMVTASFLVKHLHLDWRWGAQWFMWRLADGDIASNQHGWQWTAGTGTDAAPFHRVFNPTRQAERFDPQGTYVHKYVQELASVPAPTCLQPGAGDGLLAPANYFSPMLDVDVERRDALNRYAEARELARTNP